MSLFKKKICLLGAFGVGKTSLIQKYVKNIFSDDYITTVGVKIEKKTITLNSNQEVMLVIWDIEGSDDFSKIAETYLKGMSGYFVVADGSNFETFQTAINIRTQMNTFFPEIESVFLINKCDLVNEWSIPDEAIIALQEEKLTIIKTSAKNGQGVEEAFVRLASKMIEH